MLLKFFPKTHLDYGDSGKLNATFVRDTPDRGKFELADQNVLIIDLNN